MSDKIIAALEYLDAHTSLVHQKPRHRSLGDIDAKYNTIDPTEAVRLRGNISLTGISRINPSSAKTIDQILDEDRKKISRSSQRLKSAVSCKTLPSTPLIDTYANHVLHAVQRSHRSPLASASSTRTTVKRLSFTPPGVDVGSSDVRDEVMHGIVSKPLTHRPTRETRRISPRDTRSAPSRTKLPTSTTSQPRRSKTSLGQRKKPNAINTSSEWETNPGPFATVKMLESDMWVISHSTPSQYFQSENEAKVPRWESTVDSVPQAEKKSVPRYERQLGAAPEFGNSAQWYTFAATDPIKYKPVLTAFTEKSKGEFYSIESRVSHKVAQQLEANPSIRIGINGKVVSNSMKVANHTDDTTTDINESWSDDDDDSGRESIVNSSHSGSELNSQKQSEVETSDENENLNFSLLRYIGSARTPNPYVGSSTQGTTCTTSSGGGEKPNVRIEKDDEAVWKVLEGTSPSFWMTKEKWRQKLMETMRKAGKAKQEIEQLEEENEPLSWEKQLEKQDTKVLEANTENNHFGSKAVNLSLPVVFNKLISYNNLSADFLHTTTSGYRPHSSVSAVDKDLNVKPPFRPNSSFMTYPTSEQHSGINYKPRSFSDYLKHSENTSTMRVNADNQEGRRSKTDDVSEEELNALRQEAAYNMKLSARANDNEAQNGYTEVTAPAAVGIAELSKTPSRKVTLNSFPVKPGAVISNVEIQPSHRTSVPVSALNLSGLEEGYNVGNGPNPPTPTSPNRHGFETSPSFTPGVKTTVPLNSPKTPMSPFFKSEFARMGLKQRPGQDRPVFARREVKSSHYPATSPRSMVEHNEPESPLERNVGASNLSRSARSAPRFAGFKFPRKKQAVVNQKDITQKLQSKVEPFDAEVKFQDLIQKSGFIQISQQINIPTQKTAPAYFVEPRNPTQPVTQAVKPSSAPSGEELGASIVGISLGGSSGKSNLVIPQNFKRSKVSTVRYSSPAISTGNISPTAAKPNKLQLQGDSVRLNLDKNIHQIYRDLGIPKRNTSPSNQFNSSRKSSSRPQSSAVSRTSRYSNPESESLVVNIPTVPIADGEIPQKSNTYEENATKRERQTQLKEELCDEPPTQDHDKINMADDKEIIGDGETPHRVPTHRNNTEVADSETQYNPPSGETIPFNGKHVADAKDSKNEVSIEPQPQEAENTKDDLSAAEDTKEEDPRLNEDEKIASAVESLTLESQSLQKSASEGNINLAAIEDSSIVEDEVDIRGVTRVTVNIPPSMQVNEEK